MIKHTRYILGAIAVILVLFIIAYHPPKILIYPHLAFLGLLKRGVAIIILCAFMCLFRVFRGPTHADRVVGMDMLGILIIGICALLSISTKRSWYMDIGIAWTLQSFITTLALAKFLEGKDFDD
ncbi:MAG: cation:proton antiporter [Candidatus Omnitrophica bacterium]|nr:cation:proton antiporter [Candidatus Omnitrophota bacterium]